MSPHAGCHPPTSSITTSKGPRRSRIVAYSDVRPVSPLKKTPCRGERIANDDHSVAFRLPKRAAGKVLRRCCRHHHVGAGQAMRLPPVELDDALGRYAPRFEVRSDAQRRHHRHRAVPGERMDRRVVQVVVVIVRDQHRVHRRQIPQAHRNRLKALGPDQPERRRALAPDGVGQHAHAIDLDQHRRMTEPGHSQAAGGRALPRRARIEGHERRFGISRAARAQELAQRGSRRRRIAQRRRNRMNVAKALAGPTRRRGHPLETQAAGSGAKRLHARQSIPAE